MGLSPSSSTTRWFEAFFNDHAVFHSVTHVVLLGSPGQHSPQSSQCLDEGCRGFGIGWGRLWHLMAYNMAIFRWDEHENEAAWFMNVEVNSFKSYENTQEVQHGIGAANASWISGVSLKIFLLLDSSSLLVFGAQHLHFWNWRVKFRCVWQNMLWWEGST